MSENTPPAVPPTDSPTDPPMSAKPAKRKRRWKRWLLVGTIGVPVFAVVGVLLLPTILSLGPVRSMAVSFAGPKVAPNGSLKIDSWSFGWFGGQKIDGITLFDDQNAAVAHLNVETGASLLALARGNYDLKQANVTGDFDVRIDPLTNRINVLHILGADAKPAVATTEPQAKVDKPKADEKPKGESKPAEPTKVPDVRGKVHVAMSGTVSSTNASDTSIPFTKIEKADLDVDLSDIDKGVGLNGTIAANVDGKPARITVGGTVDAIENHVVLTDYTKVGAKLDVAIEQVDLAVVKVALAAQAAMNHATPPDVDVAGLLAGKLHVDVVPGGAATITSDALGVDALSVRAAALKGDTLAMKRVDLPLSLTRDASTGVYTVASTGLRSDLATVDIAGTLPEAVVTNLTAKHAPGGVGQIVVKTDVPSFVALSKMLPHTLVLPEGTELTGGKLNDVLTLDVLADGAKVANALTLDAQGTRAGKPIEIQSASAKTSASVALRDGLVVDPIPDVRDVAIDVAAPFATIKGGGVPTKLQVDGNVDLTRFYADVSQFIDVAKTPALVGLKLDGQSTFALTTNGDPMNLATPLDAKLTFQTTGLTVATKAQPYLDREAIQGNVDVLYKRTPAVNLATFQALAISSQSGLLELSTVGDPMWVQWPTSPTSGGTIGGKGELHLRTSKLDRLIAMAGKPADASTQVTRGAVDSTITLASDAAGATYTVASKTDVTQLDVGKLLKNETISLDSHSTLPAAMTSATSTFDLTSAFATVKGDADVLLKGADGTAPPTLAMIRSANFSGDVPSLAKLYGLAAAISPPAVVKDATTGKPLPPMSVDGGSLAFVGKVTRDDARQLTSVALNVPGIKDLTLSRGEATFSPTRPITFAMTADLTTNNNAPNADKAKASALDNVDRAVATIDLNAPGLATMKTSTPIDVSGLRQPTPIAKGVLHTTASLGPVFNLLTVVSGSPPKQYAGDVVSDETLATRGNAIQVAGTGRVTKLTPTGPDAKPLPAQLQTIELTNDVSLDLSDAKSMAVAIAKLDVVAPEARDALAIDVTGKLRDLGTNNAIDNLVAKVSYDVPQLWPVIQPLVDPTGTSLGKVDNLAGKYAKTFTISGSYPTMKPDGKTPIAFNDSIKSLVVNGDVQIDQATLTEKGVDVANVSLPISLKNGVARIAFADGTAPKPMTLNAGTADLGGLSVNLAGTEPILGDVKSKQLVKGATLNPVLSNALGKFFNPIFPNATKATANIDVVLTSTDLHLGKSLTTKDSGRAVVVMSLTDLVIANPLSENLLGGVVNQVSKLTGQSGVDTKNISDLTGEMKDATFTLDRGVVTQDATFMIGNQGAVDDKGQPKRYPFKFAGDVQLSNLAMNLTAGFPMGLLKDKLKGDAADILGYAPDNLNLGLTGTTSAPKLDTGKFSKMLTEAAAKFGTSKLLGGNKGDKNGVADDGKKSDKQKLGDLIGGLLGDKKGAAADPAAPGDATPPADDSDDAPKKKKKKKGDGD